jgi:hypothetical protein
MMTSGPSAFRSPVGRDRHALVVSAVFVQLLALPGYDSPV